MKVKHLNEAVKLAKKVSGENTRTCVKIDGIPVLFEIDKDWSIIHGENEDLVCLKADLARNQAIAKGSKDLINSFFSEHYERIG